MQRSPYPSHHHVSSSYIYNNANVNLYQSSSAVPPPSPRFTYSHVLSTPSYSMYPPYQQPPPSINPAGFIRAPFSYHYSNPPMTRMPFSNDYQDSMYSLRKRKWPGIVCTVLFLYCILVSCFLQVVFATFFLSIQYFNGYFLSSRTDYVFRLESVYSDDSSLV